ncbi:MAG: hypothetical protein L0Y54_02630 [Sporichthyaceae bacterium]|nr:hypothetical protein [Sporichthyaceae bacterium]
MVEKRVRVQNATVAALALETQLNAVVARGLTPEQKATAAGVSEFLDRANAAAYGTAPKPWALVRWWRGTLVDQAHQNLHAARALMVDLLDTTELEAEVPRTLARIQSAPHREDPRQIDRDKLAALPPAKLRVVLRRSIEDGYAAADRQHERLRSLRNIVLLSALLIAVLVG